ncbi:hypothetical protein ANT_09560 [Candidatus Vecturithrix granuli]|uniref:Uncharacterized protein n=1 Tax=Vecturithrix granuli TaxID=1499967 RepID=A0A081C0G0_VECG1|nr:hypothetical protein ANT_09560 [Candidatus Vecturithrix granuli]
MNIIAFLKRKQRVWTWIQILILAAFFMWFVQDLARQTIAVSLVSLLWGAKLLLYTLPQPLIWGVFLVIGTYILLKSLIPSQLFQSQKGGTVSETHGKVEKLADLFQLANQSEYSRRKLAQYLTTVTLDILEFQRQESREQLYRALQTGSLEIDQELRQYFQTALAKKTVSSSTGLWAKIHERFAAQKQQTPLDLEPVTIIRFLEDQLEGGGKKNRVSLKKPDF